VFGTVAAPGYYYTPADVVLRDLVMRAGGPTGEADMNKAVIRRGTEVIWKAGDVRVALADGLSLDALHLRAGDEISIPQRRSMDTNTIIALVSTSVALLATILSLSN
jgi:protein involved in polysaccharide export with SLBB domain